MAVATQNGTQIGNGIHEKANGTPPPKADPPVGMNVALTANDPESVPAILKSISSFAEAPSVDDHSTRLALLAQARNLVRALETPRETMIKHTWAQAGCFTAITTCYEAGVFEVMASGGGKPRKVTDIASILGISHEVLARLMKHIAAMGYIKETNVDEYAPTNFAKALTIPNIGDGYPCLAGCGHPPCSKFPEYMRKTNYTTSTDPKAGPYQYWNGTEMNLFEYCMSHPPLGLQFNRHMGGYRQGRPSWMDTGFYPVEDRLVQGLSDSQDAALLVDIGGGLGHDIQEFASKKPNVPGRLVLQDLPEVIDTIQELDPKIERMKYDFHTPQPVKGARAYYMHSVMHDWPDKVCQSILSQIAAAMKPGYSKILINENIIPDTDADWQATALDMMMLTLFSSKERTLADWYKLLESPELGLRISGVWSKEGSQESLIEVELATS